MDFSADTDMHCNNKNNPKNYTMMKADKHKCVKITISCHSLEKIFKLNVNY